MSNVRVASVMFLIGMSAIAAGQTCESILIPDGSVELWKDAISAGVDVTTGIDGKAGHEIFLQIHNGENFTAYLGATFDHESGAVACETGAVALAPGDTKTWRLIVAEQQQHYILTVASSKPLDVSVHSILRTQTLSFQVTGSGSIASSPAGLNCPKECAAKFRYSEALTLLPRPTTRFRGFSGDPDCGATIVLRRDLNCKADFERLIGWFRHANGGFERTEPSEGRIIWKEHHVQSPERFYYFVETGQDSTWIYGRDDSRRYSIRFPKVGGWVELKHDTRDVWSNLYSVMPELQ